jgi:hypothetical protein
MQQGTVKAGDSSFLPTVLRSRGRKNAADLTACTLMPIQSSKGENVLFRETLNQGRSNERISAFAPSVQPTLQRSDAPHASVS